MKWYTAPYAFSFVGLLGELRLMRTPSFFMLLWCLSLLQEAKKNETTVIEPLFAGILCTCDTFVTIGMKGWQGLAVFLIMRRIEEAMSCFEAISIAFHKANFETREKFSLSEPDQSSIISTLTKAGARDVMILATCNRVECYWTYLAKKEVESILREFIDVKQNVWKSSCRHMSGSAAVKHPTN